MYVYNTVAAATSTALPVFQKYNSVYSAVHYLFLFPWSITNFVRKLSYEVTKVNILMVNVFKVKYFIWTVRTATLALIVNLNRDFNSCCQNHTKLTLKQLALKGNTY